MFVKCKCNNCSEHVEFDQAIVGSTIQCPSCGMDTVLFIPGRPQPSGAPRHLSDDFVAQAIRSRPKPSGPVIATTGNDISGRTIESYLGIVRGIVVRSPTPGQAVFGSLKAGWVGGNIEDFAEVCEQARKEAFYRMIQHASEMEADAIITVRYDATEFAPEITEVLCYGTAVKLVQNDAPSGARNLSPESPPS